MATYVNDLRLKEIATGDESGTWGASTNTNLELIAEAFSFGTEAITTNADTHTTTIADGSTDPGRSIFLKYTGTLDSACTITIGPNTVSKLWLIENATSGSQNIIIKQGSGATVTIANGQTKAIYSDGAGSGGAMVDAFQDLSIPDLFIDDDLTVGDDLTVTGLATIGETLAVTGVLTANAGVVVDNITIDGTEIDLSSGDLTIDVAGDIILDADGGDVNFKDAGTEYLRITNATNGPEIFSPSNDGDLFLKGVDGGSTITALTLDMSAAGIATFNSGINIGNRGSASDPTLQSSIDPDTGVFWGGSNILGFASGGAERLRVSSEVVVNDPGNDANFRVESSGNTNMLFVDAGNDRVGIGTGSPSHELDVVSTASGTSRTLRVASTASSGDNDATIIISNGGSGDAMLRFDYEGSNTDRARIGVSSSAQQLEFYTAGNNKRLTIDSSGHVFPNAVNSQDLGLNGNEFRSLYLDTSIISSNPLGIVCGTHLEVDVGGNIKLDADDNGEVRFLDGGTQYATIKKDGNNALFQSIVADGDFLIQGIDGSSFVTAASFDMSEGGAATFRKITMDGIGGTSPIFEMINNDNEDTDTGRETSLRFSGHRSGGEDVINAQISGHHDGSADDDKGLMIFFTNGGSGITERVRIDSAGATTFSGNVKASDILASGSGGLSLQTDDGVKRITLEDSGTITLGNNSLAAATTLNARRTGATGDILRLSGGNSNVGEFAVILIHGENVTGGTQKGIITFNTIDVAAVGDATLQERMRVAAAGDVFIGKTSSSVTTVGCAIAKNGTSQFIAQGNNNTPMAIGSSDDNTLTLVNFHGASSTPGGSISITSGTSVAYLTSSDYRLKENITDLTNATDRLKQLAPKRFNFTNDADRTVDGFLAHEVSSIVPEAVNGEKDAMRDEEYEVTPAVRDDDGNLVKEAVMGTRSVPDYQGIDQSKLVPLLVATIKELEARIAALESE